MADDFDPPLRSAVGDAAGQGQRLQHRQLFAQREAAGILHLAGHIHVRHPRDEDPVAVAQLDVERAAARLQRAEAHLERLGAGQTVGPNRAAMRPGDQGDVAGAVGGRSGARQHVKHGGFGGQWIRARSFHFAEYVDGSGARVLDRDGNLRRPHVAVGQHPPELLLDVAQHLAAGAHPADEREHEGPVRVDGVFARQVFLVEDGDVQHVLQPDDVVGLLGGRHRVDHSEHNAGNERDQTMEWAHIRVSRRGEHGLK